ncbi:MAG: radical SAM protein, partial [Patescibacteria group bacterium]
KKTIAFGPIMLATAASKLFDWDVEIIHERGCRKWIKKDKDGKIDHRLLQNERPADAVGFYCGISDTIPRVWNLAKFYKSENVLTVAGGLHSHYQPLESLNHSIDIVVHGDGEQTIKQILINFQKGKSFSKIPGISFLRDGKIITNPQEPIERDQSLFLENLPFPNFGLIRDCKIKEYPIGRIRGCGMNCEFCSVKEKARWCSPEKLFEMVQFLVETENAKHFFLVDDRTEEDEEGSMRFFKLIKEKYGRKLFFTVQVRLEAARNREFLALMRDAGVGGICVGCESPLDEELRAMRKGYKSTDMIKWIQIYRSFEFFIHGMFIFGYPGVKTSLSAQEKMRWFKSFIRRAKFDTIQVLKPIPIVGSELRKRLEREGKLLPLEVVPWDKYDGNHVCFIPDDMTIEELQKYPTEIMKWFYHKRSFWQIGLRTLVMPFDYILRGWNFWYRGWRNDIVRFIGSRIYAKWKRRNDESAFVAHIENHLRSIQGKS